MQASLFAGAVLALATPVFCQAQDEARAPSAPESVFGSFPLLFEANGGSYDPDVAFVSRGRGYQLFLTREGTTLALRKNNERGFGAAVRTVFVGANPDPEIRGEGELPTRIHYLRGNDRAGWSTHNVTYRQVRYTEVWPGIDAVFYERDGELEFDFVVAPGADPDAIRVRYEGVGSVALGEKGDLVLRTSAGDLAQSAPVLYQLDGDERRAVGGRAQLLTDDTVAFEVDAYDSERPLVIDPVLVFATYLSGSGSDVLTDVTNYATVIIGNSPTFAVCGYSDSTDLPGTAGTIQPNKTSGYTDAIVAMIDTDGTNLRWLTYLGGSNCTSPNWAYDDDRAYAIDTHWLIDNGVIVAGQTACHDFPTTPGALKTTHVQSDGLDGFIASLSEDGSTLRYSTYLGSTGDDRILAIDSDNNGVGIYATGDTVSGFPITTGALQSGQSGSLMAAFVAKLPYTMDSLVYSMYLSGTQGRHHGTDISVNFAGEAFVVGQTSGSGFPVNNGFQTTHGGLNDGFLVRLSADGSTMLYGTFLGGSGDESDPSHSFSVDCGLGGQAWFGGSSSSTDYPVTPGAFQSSRTSGSFDHNAVVTHLDTNSTGAASLIWSTYFGGGLDSTLDLQSNTYEVTVYGRTSSSSFPLVEPWQRKQAAGDLFLTIFDQTGAVTFSTIFGGNGAEPNGSTERAGMASTGYGQSFYIVGSTSSTDLGTPSSMQPTLPATSGPSAGFIAKFTGTGSAADVEVRNPCTGTAPPGGLMALTGMVTKHKASIAIDDPTNYANLTPGSTLAYWTLAAAPDPNYPCGTLLPQGFGIGGTGAEMLIGLQTQVSVYIGLWSGPQTPVIATLDVPANTPTGVTLFTQGMLLDAAGGQIVFTNAVDFTVGN